MILPELVLFEESTTLSPIFAGPLLSQTQPEFTAFDAHFGQL